MRLCAFHGQQSLPYRSIDIGQAKRRLLLFSAHPALLANTVLISPHALTYSIPTLLAVFRPIEMGEDKGSSAAPAPAVRVLAVSRVAPAERAGGGDQERVVKLSFFDTPWIVLPPIQRVFLYDLPAPAFAAAVARLKASLAATLAPYLPLAGKLSYLADAEEVVIDCASDPGVAFLEAEAAADFRRLAGDEAHDVAALVALVPDLDARVLPAPVLSVQATRLGEEGMALGVSVHHAVADGQAVWRFMAAWAAAAWEGSPVNAELGPPHYTREVINFPRGDEFARRMLKMVAPNLPVVCISTLSLSSTSIAKIITVV
jgi:hypothetical protein